MNGRKSFVTRIALLVVALCLVTCMLLACTQSGSVESIEVDSSSNAGYYMLEGFNIATLKLIVHYEDGSANVINVEKSMLTTTAQNELKTGGQKEITINYKGKTTIASFYLAEGDEKVVKVTFNDANGKKIKTVTTLEGGSVEDDAPTADELEVEGQTFRGWVDAEDNIVDLTEITSSITVTAAYTTSTTKYRVSFYDYKGDQVGRTQEIEEGASVYAPTYNKPAEIKSYTWKDVTFPIIVRSNISVYMSAEYNEYSVSYAYAYEAQRSSVTYLDMHEEVKYGRSATLLNDARNYITGTLKRTIVEPPSASTTIYRDTTFIFILESPKIDITVYNAYENETDNRVRVNKTQYLLGSKFSFPIGTADAVSGKTFTGWMLSGNGKKSAPFASGSSWTVDDTYGSDVKVIPSYEKTLATVTYSYSFNVVVGQGNSARTATYRYDHVVSKDAKYEIYGGGDKEDKNIINFKKVEEEFSLFQTNVSTGRITGFSDGSETGIAALNAITKFKISSVKYNNNNFNVDSVVTIQTTQLAFSVQLTAADNGTQALTYKEVLVLTAPAVSLYPGDTAEWKYDETTIGNFPYVLTPGENEGFSLAKLKYKTTLTDTFITAPGYYAVGLEAGKDIPQSGLFIKENETYKNAYSSAENAENKTVGGTTYYVYYVPAGYAVADAETGADVPKDTYYTYAAGAFSLTTDDKVQEGKTYFINNYKENTAVYVAGTDVDFTTGAGYFTGYEATGLDSSYDMQNKPNIYIPDRKEKTYEDLAGAEKTISIPVVSIGTKAFNKKTSYTDFASETAALYVIGGISKNVILIRDGAFAGCNIYDVESFPNLVVIGAHAFDYAVLQDAVSFPVAVSLGESCFEHLNAYNKSGEAELTFASERLTIVPEKAFSGIYGELTLTFTDKIATIRDSAFESSMGLTSVAPLTGVVSVGQRAFGKTALTEIVLPNLQTVGSKAFHSMPYLTTVVLGENATLRQETIDMNIIEGSLNVEVLSIGRQDEETEEAAQAAAGDTESVGDTKVKTISNTIAASSDQYGLKTLKLPASLTTVTADKFRSFALLREVIVPGAAINYYTDDGVLYKKLENNEYKLLYYPVNKIGDYVADMPSSAAKVTVVPSAFGSAQVSLIDLTGLADTVAVAVDGSGSVPACGIKVAYVEDKVNVVALSEVANVYVTNKEKSAFPAGWNEDKVFVASDYSYYYYTDGDLLFSLSTVNNKKNAAVVRGYQYAETITVPATVTVGETEYTVNEIKAGAFFGFEKLTTLTVNARLYILPDNVFGSGDTKCEKLVNMTFDGWTTDDNNTKFVTATSFKFTKWYDDRTIIYAGGEAFGCNDKDQMVITAEEMTNSGFTTTISANFFKGTKIVSISFPDTLQIIEKNAFLNCTQLKTVNFANVTTIRESAFQGCTALEKANVGSLNDMGNYAFSGCSSLTEFRAPYLPRLAVGVFNECGRLTEVDLSGVTELLAGTDGNSLAFNNCSMLKSVSFDAFTGDIIPARAFYGCSSLVFFDFDDAYSTVTTIGEEAFASCVNLSYIRLGSNVINIGDSAFNGCTKLNVEIQYAFGGLYNAQTYNSGDELYTSNDSSVSISLNAFPAATTKFFIDAQTDVSKTFLSKFDRVGSTRPKITFEFYQETQATVKLPDSLGMTTKEGLLFKSIKASEFNGLQFIGWSTSENDYAEINFPVVFSVDTTIYARYIDVLQGTLSSGDVRYVYLVEQQPEIELESEESYRTKIESVITEKVLRANNQTFTLDGDSKLPVTTKQLTTIARNANYSDAITYLRSVGALNEFSETITWKYRLTNKDTGASGSETTFTSFPLVIRNVKADDKIEIFAEISGLRYVYIAGADNDKCLQLKSFTTTVEYGNIGEFGYAIVNYTSADNANVVIPARYSDGTNGEADIIVLYAGAFTASSLTKVELPENIRVMLKGRINEGSFENTSTFSDTFTEITLPTHLHYIEDGLFRGLSNLSLIKNFGDELLYVSRESFWGTEWYKKAVWAAENGENNGFVMAGKVAIEYVGDSSSVFVSTGVETYNEDSKAFADGVILDWTLTDEDGVVVEEQTLKFVHTAIGGSTVVTLTGDDGAIVDDIYTITLNLESTPIMKVTLYATAVGDKKVGQIKEIRFLAASYVSDLALGVNKSYRLIASTPKNTITLPENAVKVVDSILEGYTDMTKLIINSNLEYIGARAFYGSALTSIAYTGEGQEKSKISSIGKDAFANTPWYTSLESVIVGTVYLKHNNTGAGRRLDSGKYSVDVPEFVTRIAEGAFENATSLGAVNFAGNKVTVIEKYAFAGSGIETVTLTSSVNKLGRGVFKNALSLADVDMKNSSLTVLPQDTFLGCTSLQNLSLPGSVTSFGRNAFKNALKLAAISASGISQLNVEEGSVLNGGNLVGVNDGSALADTKWYSPDKTDEDLFITIGSVLVKFVLGKTNEEKVLSGETTSVFVEIPASVQTVLKNAFKDNTTITSVTFPASVVLIEQSAFEGCTKLETIDFETGSLLTEIGACAFKGCSALKTVKLPSELKKIGQQAFFETLITTAVRNEKGNVIEDNGFTVPGNVTEIGAQAFAKVHTLTYLNLGSKISSIGAGAFDTNSGDTKGVLYKINWEAVVPSEEDGNVSFEELTTVLNGYSYKLRDIIATGSNITLRIYFPGNVYEFISTSDGDFYKNVWLNDEMFVSKNLADVDGDKLKYLPQVILKVEGTADVTLYTETITSLDSLSMPKKDGSTFEKWVILMDDGSEVDFDYPYEVRVSELKLKAKFIDNNPETYDPATLGYEVYFDEKDTVQDSSAKIISVENGVKTLYVPATVRGIKVTSIDLNGVNEEVENIVFTKAENFKENTRNIFVNYKNLRSVTVPNDASSIDFVITTVQLTKTLDDGTEVTESFQVIYESTGSGQGGKLIAFIGKAEGYEFTIPSGVTEICEGAFRNSALTSIYIPSSVTKIGDNAFNKELKSIKVQKNIYIQEATSAIFDERSDANSLWNTVASNTAYSDYVEIRGLKSSNTNANKDVDGYFYAFANIMLGYAYSSGTDLEMPTAINGFDITVLASNMFSVGNAASFVKVKLPKNVKKINASAFVNCDITGGIDENAVTVSGDNNTPVYSPYYAQLTDIADDVFKNKTFYENANLRMLLLGHVLVKAKYTAERIVVPGNVEAIMKDAFSNSQVVSVILPNGLTSIGANAFYGADKLTSISIPNTVTYIGSSAFFRCSKLAKVEFDTAASALKTLGIQAFYNCTSLESIALPANLETIGNSAFAGCTKLSSVTFNRLIEVASAEVGGESEWHEVEGTSKLTKIGTAAFSGCSALTQISIPNGVEAIEENTFQACISLLRVEFDIQNSRLKVIGKSAFSGCRKLGSVFKAVSATDGNNDNYASSGFSWVPDGQGSGYYTADLITLNLPNALTKVDNYAFQNCEGLWGVQFNYNILELGSGVFAGCKSLAKINFYRATPPSIKNDTFEIGDGAYYRLRIYVNQSESSSSDKNYGSIMSNYIEAWTKEDDSGEKPTINQKSLKYYIYERGDMPTLTIKSGGTSQEYRTDVYIVEVTQVGGGTERNWTYGSLAQTNGWYYGGDITYKDDTTTRTSSTGEYGNQEYMISGDKAFIVIVVDYDNVEVNR